jgi:coproporphyrinogen III oxidase-like Fe-S oxidoreductase
MRISDEDLEYYGDLFEAMELAKHITFYQFIHAPHWYIHKYSEEKATPLRGPLRRACEGIEAELERWEQALAAQRRIDNGHVFQPMKHNRYPR